MELLSAFVFCIVLLCSDAQNQPFVASADCNGTEEDAGVALDLINKHRRDGYIFSLLRVADAHIQHVENASIFYLTLDVLETECPVISRKHWASCELGSFLGTSDFGRCHAVIYINRLFRITRLYAYNCTMSPVPPPLYECKRCPVRITVLENVQQYRGEAERILERYNQDSNQTSHFEVDKVTKVLMAVADRTVYRVEFTIKETRRPKPRCEFLRDRQMHTGFCVGRVLNGTKDLEGVEVETCEFYDIPHKNSGRHPFHGHQDDGECHRHCNVSGCGCRYPGHRHHHPHHHHHHHRPPHHHHHHHHRPHHHHHRPPHHHHCPPPHHHHKHRRCQSHCGPTGPVGPYNSSKESQEKDYPDFPPPPGPHYPPPPPGGPHHFPPSRFPPPPPGPPPVPGQPFWPPPPHHPPKEPYFHPNGSQYGDQDDRRKRKEWHEMGRVGSSEEHDLFRSPHSLLEVDSVYRIPLESEHDILQDPGADFSYPSHKTPVPWLFPLNPSESESCPGKLKIDLRFDLLSLYLPPLMNRTHFH